MHHLAYIYRSPLPTQHLIAIAVVLSVLALVVYVRNMKRQPVASVFLLLMRLSVIIALAMLLAGPSELPPTTPAVGKPTLHIFLDTSGSMLTPDVRGRPRIEFAIERWLGEEQLDKLRAHYEVRMFSFDAATFPLSQMNLTMDIEKLAIGKTSHIAHNLRQAVMQMPLAVPGSAMLVLSDGHDSQAEPLTQVASLAAARSVPVHTAAFGGRTMQQDLALSASLSQRFLIAKEPGTIAVRIRQTGLDQAASQLQVRQGVELVTQPVQFDGQREVEITLPVMHEKPGVYEYTLTVDPAKGETELGNNTRTVFVEVTDERIKVLLLEGEPYWDTKYLAQSLRKDALIELAHITQMNEMKQSRIITRGDASAAAVVPARAEDLARYNVVILGRGLEHVLDEDQARLLPAYVSEHGGHVIMARGRPYDPASLVGQTMARSWSMLEPVVWGGGGGAAGGGGVLMRDLSWELTPTGLDEPCFAFDALGISAQRAVPELKAYTAMIAVDRVKPAAQVLAHVVPHGGAVAGAPAGASAQPGLVRMQVGGGHVVAILGEGLWQWSHLPPNLKQYDGMYDTFWSNLVRSLAMGSRFQPNEEVALEVGTTNGRLGDPVTITVITRALPRDFEFAPTLRVIDPAGTAHEPALQKLTGGTRLQATYRPQATGVHTVTLDATPLKPDRHERKFSVYSEDIERLESSADPDGLKALADQSGGLFFAPDQAGDLPAQLARALAAQVTPDQPEYVWNQGWVLALLLIWTGLEWLARRGAGLI